LINCTLKAGYIMHSEETMGILIYELYNNFNKQKNFKLYSTGEKSP